LFKLNFEQICFWQEYIGIHVSKETSFKEHHTFFTTYTSCTHVCKAYQCAHCGRKSHLSKFCYNKLNVINKYIGVHKTNPIRPKKVWVPKDIFKSVDAGTRQDHFDIESDDILIAVLLEAYDMGNPIKDVWKWHRHLWIWFKMKDHRFW